MHIVTKVMYIFMVFIVQKTLRLSSLDQIDQSGRRERLLVANQPRRRLERRQIVRGRRHLADGAPMHEAPPQLQFGGQLAAIGQQRRGHGAKVDEGDQQLS